jgi:primosomal protein N' (replication factor Y)
VSEVEEAIAEVAPIPPIPDRPVLSYLVPASLSRLVRNGARVLIPLGKRQVTGIVVGEGAPREGVELKPILDVLDAEPLLSSDLLELCRFASTYYLSPLGEVLATAVLAGLRAQSHRTVRRTATEPPRDLPRLERAILAALPPGRTLKTTTLARSIGSTAFYDGLRSLAERGLVTVEEIPARAEARILRERVLRGGRALSAEDRATLGRKAPARARLLDRIHEAGTAGVLASALGPASGEALRALVAKGLVSVEHRETYRQVIRGGDGSDDRLSAGPFALTPAQDLAVAAITAETRFAPFLLRGVTGSGKTEVYLQSAARVLAEGRGVLVLVPEIALTHDLVTRVCARFGGAVAVLHSALSPGERFDEWRRLSRREARIAVGVRSAVFAPVPSLGLVIVDEEHDGSYKQEDGLRYNARDLAIVRARNAGCPAVLGSATPSIESHHNAVTGRYRLLELAERIENRPLPEVDTVDLRTEKPEGEPAVFAPRLKAALRENLEKGRQSLLFLNRRGYAHYLQCTLCGFVLGCPNCSVTLTFHLRSRRLRCHHCDYGQRAPDLCPECSGPSLRDFGVGTEQVEEVVRALLPEARLRRMDRDTMSPKGALGKVLTDWAAGRVDVLVGTQMVTKGHDVPGVTFVGVVASDQALNFPDFRAAERTFQMLTQVAGRAGRGDEPGRVLVQTLRPSHYAIRFALKHDFIGFAEEELRYRRALGYPPFTRLANLRLDGLDPGRVEAAARDLATRLRQASLAAGRSRPTTVLGPAPAPLERLRGRFRWQILVKARDPAALRSVVAPAVEAAPRQTGVRVAVDVDPYGML